jgi:hypothetical protein
VEGVLELIIAPLLITPGVHLSLDMGAIHHGEAVRDKPLLPGQLYNLIEDRGKSLLTQAISKAGETGEVRRWLVYSKPHKPLQGQIEVDLFFCPAIGDVAEKLKEKSTALSSSLRK